MGSCSQVVNQAKFSGCGEAVRLVAVENQKTRLLNSSTLQRETFRYERGLNSRM